MYYEWMGTAVNLVAEWGSLSLLTGLRDLFVLYIKLGFSMSSLFISFNFFFP